MTFCYDKDLLEYMQAKGKHNIVVEIASSDSSDFEVTELHVHLCSDKDAEFFKNKKRFTAHESEAGLVLLPPYKLEYDDTISFSLKKLLFIPYLKYTGIRL